MSYGLTKGALLFALPVLPRMHACMHQLIEERTNERERVRNLHGMQMQTMAVYSILVLCNAVMDK
jgi:hypothetical protein